jgi:hypothetical protein
MFLLSPYRFGNTPSDPNFSNVVLLCHMEGANGGATFTDSSSSAKTITVLTGTTNSNTQVKFGSTSCFITGSDSGGLSLASSADFGFGAGDFTIEAWCYATNVTSRLNTIFDCRLSGATGVQLFIGGGAYTVAASSIGCSSNTGILATGTGVSANTWLHCALTRSGTTLRGFVGGAQAFSVTDSRTYASSAAVYIGRDPNGTSLQGFGGYLDDVRVTKGVARYTANFTPPTAAFPDH